MSYVAVERDSSVIVKGLDSFNIKHITECGQCFRWNEMQDGSYTGVALGKVINVVQLENTVEFKNCRLEEFEFFWKPYFDLDRDYLEVKRRVSVDSIMEKSVEFGDGIRILRQEPWEMLISFIISARNSIPNIKKTVEKLSRAFGERICKLDGVEYYAFPTAEVLSKLSEEDIRQYGTSFRTKYIMEVSKAVAGTAGIDSLGERPTDEARTILMEFPGVGPKVSDCILLFGLAKHDVFPVDVWVQRVMDECYLNGKYKNLNKIRDYGLEMFGDLAGFGQQYLFYYARENGIGKKK